MPTERAVQTLPGPTHSGAKHSGTKYHIYSNRFNYRDLYFTDFFQTNNHEQVMGIAFPTLSIMEILASNSLLKSSKTFRISNESSIAGIT